MNSKINLLKILVPGKKYYFLKFLIPSSRTLLSATDATIQSDLILIWGSFLFLVALCLFPLWPWCLGRIPPDTNVARLIYPALSFHCLKLFRHFSIQDKFRICLHGIEYFSQLIFLYKGRYAIILLYKILFCLDTFSNIFFHSFCDCIKWAFIKKVFSILKRNSFHLLR